MNQPSLFDAIPTPPKAPNPASMYQRVKRKYPETIVFVRLGDRVEVFDADARTVAKVLGVSLGRIGEHDACHMPYSEFEKRLETIIKAGFKVAVAEPMTKNVGDKV